MVYATIYLFGDQFMKLIKVRGAPSQDTCCLEMSGAATVLIMEAGFGLGSVCMEIVPGFIF